MNMKKTKRRYVMTARAAKTEATRERIRASAVELYSGGEIDEFTLDEVARRAGTTVQTVLRTFGSKEDLLFAALEVMADSGVPLRTTPPGDVAEAVTAIFDVYETMGDFVMQRLNDERRHPALKPLLAVGRHGHRSWVKTAFAPLLQKLQGSEQAQLRHALTAVTDVYVWKLLRRDSGLSRAAAEAVVRKLITGVVQQETSHGTDSLAELVRRREPAA
jgi:AcrR family transcriptional regulator